MSNKLWTLHFTRICAANFLLFVSLYMLLPVIPALMAARLDVPIQQTGTLFLLFTLGMVLVGPFYAYLVDAYKRKQVCVLSFLTMMAATIGFNYVTSMPQLCLLALVQGACFGMATTAGITLAIDITNSTHRSQGNIAFAWVARMGMMTGLALGVWLTISQYHLPTILNISVGIGLGGILILSMIHIPFRAPIGTQLCSCDRFFLPLGWLPALNLIFIGFIPGILLPILTRSFDTVVMQTAGFEYTFPFFAVVLVGFILSIFAGKMLFREENKSGNKIMAGLMCMIASLGLLLISNSWCEGIAAVLLGFGIGFVTPEFLMMFVKLSQHCQRGTANTTHLLAWELGISLGIATACWLNMSYPHEVILQVGLLAGVVSLVFFRWVTIPYFKRKRVR